MKTKITKLKLSISMLFLFALPLSAFSQTTLAYVCGATPVTLTPDLKGYVLVAGDQILWKNTTAGTTVTQTITEGANFTPSDLVVGDNSYTVQIVPIDPNACPGDVSDAYIIHKLPEFTAAVSSLNPSFCNSNGSTSLITATSQLGTIPAGYNLPNGIEIDFTWSATNASGAVSISTIGTPATDTKSFTMLSTAPVGTYDIFATAKYKATGVTLLPAASCEVKSSAQPIDVTLKPTKPTVTIFGI